MKHSFAVPEPGMCGCNGIMIKPYFEKDGIVIYHGDCLDIMSELEPVDAIISDPPYSSGGQFRSEIVRPSNKKYGGWSHSPDETRIPSAFYSAFSGDNKDGRVFLAWSKKWLYDVFCIAKDGALIALTTDWRQLPAITDMIQFAGWTWRGIVVWDKKTGRPVKGRFRNHIEYVIWGSRGGFENTQKIYPNSLYSEVPPTYTKRVHVTEKPVGLVMHILSILPTNICILDPFLGSGTTLVAAKQFGCKAIGIEIEEKYCEIAAKRVEKTTRLGKMSFHLDRKQERKTLELWAIK